MHIFFFANSLYNNTVKEGHKKYPKKTQLVIKDPNGTCCIPAIRNGKVGFK